MKNQPNIKQVPTRKSGALLLAGRRGALGANLGMRMKCLAVAAVALVAAGCARSTPSALADVVFRRELAQVPGDFVPCLSMDGRDADTKLLADIRKLRPDAVLGSECTYELRGSYHRASGRKAMLMDIKRLSHTEVEYIGRHGGKWADFITLEVREGADGWEVLRVIKHEAA
jgi:hypothetical protein